MIGARAGEARGGGSADHAGWLSLAATPTFAILAGLTSLAGGPMERMCGPAPWAPVNGMALMYLLMSVFHAPPWLRLIARRSGGSA